MLQGMEDNYYDAFGNSRKPGVREDKSFSDLYDILDECLLCGSNLLVRRRAGIMCRDCKALVIPGESE